MAGTTGAILTSPLEVVKTRFQSSSSILNAKEIGDFRKLNGKEFNGVNILPNNFNIITNANASTNAGSSLFKKAQINTLHARSNGGMTQAGNSHIGRSLGTTIYYNLK